MNTFCSNHIPVTALPLWEWTTIGHRDQRFMIHCGFFPVPLPESQSWWAGPEGFKCPCKKNQQSQKVRSEVWIKQTGLLDPGQAQELSHLCSLTCTMCGAPHPPTFLSLISFASCIFNNCHIHPFMDVLLAPDTQNVQTLNSLSSPKDLPTLLHCPHWCSYGLSSKTSNDISFS